MSSCAGCSALVQYCVYMDQVTQTGFCSHACLINTVWRINQVMYKISPKWHSKFSSRLTPEFALLRFTLGTTTSVLHCKRCSCLNGLKESDGLAETRQGTQVLTVGEDVCHFEKDFDPEIWSLTWTLSVRLPIAASCGLLGPGHL